MAVYQVNYKLSGGGQSPDQLKVAYVSGTSVGDAASKTVTTEPTAEISSVLELQQTIVIA